MRTLIHATPAVIFPILMVLLIMGLAGCTTWDLSTTERTAIEQLLLSTATDRALESRYLAVGNQKVYLDDQYVEAYDRPYVVSAMREKISVEGGLLVGFSEEADVTIEARSGGLAIDKSEFLLGIPAIPLPIPFLGAGQVITTPEVPFFKSTKRRARAKFAMFARAARARVHLAATGIQYGEAHHTNWVVLCVPFTTSDLWDRPRAEQ